MNVIKSVQNEPLYYISHSESLCLALIYLLVYFLLRLGIPTVKKIKEFETRKNTIVCKY